MPRFDIHLTTAVTLICLLLVPDGHARQLLEVDGIVLHGTERLVARGTGTCQVLESHHPAEQYERMKANHGQPLDVWQLDFSVHKRDRETLGSSDCPVYDCRRVAALHHVGRTCWALFRAGAVGRHHGTYPTQRHPLGRRPKRNPQDHEVPPRLSRRPAPVS